MTYFEEFHRTCVNEIHILKTKWQPISRLTKTKNKSITDSSGSGFSSLRSTDNPIDFQTCYYYCFDGDILCYLRATFIWEWFNWKKIIPITENLNKLKRKWCSLKDSREFARMLKEFRREEQWQCIHITLSCIFTKSLHISHLAMANAYSPHTIFNRF